MDIRERIQRSIVLRRELAELESGVSDEDEQRAAYVHALKRERWGLVQRFEAALALGEKHEVLPAVFSPTGLDIRAGKNGLEQARELEQSIRAVDAELARVGGSQEWRARGNPAQFERRQETVGDGR
jgi:hypothetical protein